MSNVALTVGSTLGIQVQPWYVTDADLTRMRTLGFSTVRWGIPWDRIEKRRGTYDWSEVDAFSRRLEAAGIRSIFMLGFGNRLYDGGSSAVPAPPSTTAGLTAFANYAAAAARRYTAKGFTWEIWNEPDSGAFWVPSPNPASYAKLASTTCTAIKAAVPTATVFGGAGAAMPDAVSLLSVNLYSALVRNLVTNCVDSISSHAYRMTGNYVMPLPDTIDANHIASAFYLYGRLGMPRRVSLATTEWGYPSDRVSANLQLAYLIRGVLTNVANGVLTTVWYEWRDSQLPEKGSEAFFGLNTTYGGPKAAETGYDVLKAVTQSTYVRGINTGSDRATTLLVSRDNAYYLVSWLRTADETARATLTVNGQSAGTVSYMPTITPVTDPARLTVAIN